VLSLWDWVEGLSSLTGGLGESGDGCIWGLKNNNKNIPADVRRTIVEELGHHTSVSVVHPYCFGNLLPLRLDRSCNGTQNASRETKTT